MLVLKAIFSHPCGNELLRVESDESSGSESRRAGAFFGVLPNMRPRYSDGRGRVIIRAGGEGARDQRHREDDVEYELRKERGI